MCGRSILVRIGRRQRFPDNEKLASVCCPPIWKRTSAESRCGDSHANQSIQLPLNPQSPMDVCFHLLAVPDRPQHTACSQQGGIRCFQPTRPVQPMNHSEFRFENCRSVPEPHRCKSRVQRIGSRFCLGEFASRFQVQARSARRLLARRRLFACECTCAWTDLIHSP